MEGVWQRFLNGLEPSPHAVQVYEHAAGLADSVAAYLGRGFEGGEPGIAVATPEHAKAIVERLAAPGFDDKLLVVAHADTTLASLPEHDRPSPARCERVIGGLLDQVEGRFPGRRIRVFGEMVDLLRERGRPDVAAAIQELWTSLAERRHFSLLCAYRLDVFDRGAQAEILPGICRIH